MNEHYEITSEELDEAIDELLEELDDEMILKKQSKQVTPKEKEKRKSIWDNISE